MTIGVDLGDLDPLGIYDPLLAETLRDKIAYITRMADAFARKITDPPQTSEGKERLEKFLECFPASTYADWYVTWKKWVERTEDSSIWFAPIVIRDTQEIVERNEAEFKGYYEKARKCGMNVPPYAKDKDLVDRILGVDFDSSELGLGVGVGMGTLLFAGGVGLALWLSRK